jgi:hypothetical protein
LTNSIPAIGAAIAAFGLMARDGLLVVGGLLIGVLWVSLLLTAFVLLGDAIFNSGSTSDFLKQIFGIFG